MAGYGSIILLNALHDVYGNPRRCYVVLKNNAIVGVVPSQYGNAKFIAMSLAGLEEYPVLELIVKPSALKELYASAKRAGVFHDE